MILNKFSEDFTDKVYKEIEKKNIKDFTILLPMLRIENDKLLLGTLVEISNDELYDKGKVVRPKLWVIVDNDNYNIIELNETKNKDYMDSSIIPLDKEFDDEFLNASKKLNKYEIETRIKYNEYLMSDIKNGILNFHNDIINAIDNTLIVDNKKVNASDYLIANEEEKVKKQVEEIIALVVNSKFNSIISYYHTLIEEILNEYKKSNNINIEKMKLASTILDKYYGEVYGIKYFFNV